MRGEEARVLLGFPPNSRPTPSQVKAAYRKKVWESHPDLFPVNEKSKAESRFKCISEAYNCLLSGARGQGHSTGRTRSRRRTTLLTIHSCHDAETLSQSKILVSYMDGLVLSRDTVYTGSSGGASTKRK